MLTKRLEVSPRRWLYVRVTIKVREFDGGALLAFEAAERGWGVFFGRDLYLHGPEYPRGILLEKGLTPGRYRNVTASRAAGFKVAGLCEEGLIYADLDEYERRHLDRQAFDLLERYFSWGEHQTRDLVDKLGCDPGKIAVAGNPRFDLHRPELRTIFADEVRAIQHRYGPYILINTKFSKYNTHLDFEKSLAAAWKSGKVRSPQDEADMRAYRDYHQKGFEKFMELTEQLSRQHPDKTIIVRPHPSENHDRWREKAATLPNVKVVFDGNVAEWILGSEISVHSNCTTGVESYFLGKPSISYRPVLSDRFDLFLPNALSTEAFTLEQTCDLVAAALRGETLASGKEASAQSELARHFLANADGRFASERMMDALESVDSPETPMSLPLRRLNLGAGLKRLDLRRRLAGGKAAAMARERREVLTKREVLARLTSIQKVTGRFRGLRVAELDNNVFCIYK